MTNQEKSIFKALYEQRLEALKIGQKEEIVESAQEEVVEEAQQESIEEEVTIFACPECGNMYESSELSEGVSVCPECSEGELEERVKLVVRDGKVVKKQVKTKKGRATSAQKAALAKARKKAHSSSAQKARKKSLKVRNKRISEEEALVCPKCGGEFLESEYQVGDGYLICPGCATELDIVEEEVEVEVQETQEEQVAEACAKKEEESKEEEPKDKEEEEPEDKKEESVQEDNVKPELSESLITVLKALKVEEELQEQINNKDLDAIKSFLQERFFIEIK